MRRAGSLWHKRAQFLGSNLDIEVDQSDLECSGGVLVCSALHLYVLDVFASLVVVSCNYWTV